ncbi:spindle and centriole-associated protein 1-like [Tubulanus polymorphus]|uniref:spindle and centriole-associated protein 1-like n=1 Tax=Tubulanus polymorphus TaxID=672921 RepID=UPI003DA6A109
MFLKLSELHFLLQTKRKEVHRSKNSEIVTLEKTRQLIARAMAAKSEEVAKSAEKKKVALLKEVLHDQEEFHDVISRSDKTIAMVKDLFGDNPRRYTGFPNVTIAPGQPVIEKPDGTIVAQDLTLLPEAPDFNTSQLEKLSERIMDDEALNEIEPDDEGCEEDEDVVVNYQPRFNLSRFQQFLEREQTNSIQQQNNDLSLQQNEPDNSMLTLHAENEQTVPEKDTTITIETTTSKNHKQKKSKKDNKENKTKTKKTSVKEKPESPQHMKDLRKVLGNLENEIYEYEKQIGHDDGKVDTQRTESTFSGYTVALVDAVSRLTCLLRQRDAKLQAEGHMREQLTQDVQHLHGLVDALTAEVIKSHESQMNLNIEFQQFRQKTIEEFQRMQLIQPGVHATQTPLSVSPLDLNKSKDTATDSSSDYVPRTCQSDPNISKQELHKQVKASLSNSSAPVHVVTVPKPTPLVMDKGKAKESSDLQRQIAELSAEHERAQSRIFQLQNLNQALNKITVPEPKTIPVTTCRPIPLQTVGQSEAETLVSSDDDLNQLNIVLHDQAMKKFQEPTMSPAISPIPDAGISTKKIMVSIPSLGVHDFEPLSPDPERPISPLSSIEAIPHID